METIGARIHCLRKLFRLTQSQLAEAIHLSDKVISKWENDESKPNLDDVTILSQFFGVTFDYLLLGKTTKQDEVILSKKPSEEELIADAKQDFIKKCNALIRNNNLYKYKDKIFPEKRCQYFLTKYIPKDYADVGIFHPLVEKSTEPYEIGVNLKALLAFDDYSLFEKIIALNIPFCDKNEVIDFFNKDLISDKDIHGLTDIRFYSFLSNQDILIKQSYERQVIKAQKDNAFVEFENFEELKRKEEEWINSRHKKVLNEALEKLERKHPNYWKIVKILIEGGAFVQKVVGTNSDNGSYYSYAVYADDIFVTELLYDAACAKA